MDTQSNNQSSQPKDNRLLIYSLLGGALLLSWGYMFFNNREVEKTEQQLVSQNTEVANELTEVKDLYNEASFRLDSLMGVNESLTQSSNAEIVRLKAEISKILSNKKASDADLARARTMIKELNGRIAGLVEEVEQLKGENQALASENDMIKKQKDEVESDLARTKSEKADVEKELESTKDVAATMRASSIQIFAINERSGGKEKETTSAKKADKLRINFNLDENKIAQAGKKEIYVVLYDPSGKVVYNAPADAFKRRDGGSQLYTSKILVDYEPSKKVPVSVDWKNDRNFSEGDYRIEIYHNGFKIGDQVRTMRKGGIFS
jgi:uncharacterized small protein (DUF1192 family)